MLVMSPIGIMAPIYAGWVYDTTGSYLTVFTTFAVILTIGGIVACFMLPPKPPAQITDVRKFV